MKFDMPLNNETKPTYLFIFSQPESIYILSEHILFWS